MWRRQNKLSAKTVVHKRTPGYYGDGDGLYLQVSESGSKSWIYRYSIRGVTLSRSGKQISREMGLGGYPTFSLEEARQRAQAQRKLVADGIDPIQARNDAKAQAALERAKVMTFAECCTRYIEAHRAGWKNPKHADQWENTLTTYCGPVMGHLPVAAVDTALVSKVLDPIWTTKHETATRLRARIENVLAWATVRGYRTGDNPARWRGHLKQLLPNIKKSLRVEHHAALPFRDVAAFIKELQTHKSLTAQVLEFTILTACRTGEIIAARVDEFDLKNRVWTVPAKRMKAGKEHRVPLSQRAMEIVAPLIDAAGDGYVFPGLGKNTHLSNMAMLTFLKRMDKQFTVHGFRSSFRDWAAECTGYPREVCEMALAHTLSDKVEAAYRRGDLFEKRQRLMSDWAKFCAQGMPSATVTALKAGRKK